MTSSLPTNAARAFFSIAAHYRVSPWQLAKVDHLRLTGVIVPGQRLRCDPAQTRPVGAEQLEARVLVDRVLRQRGPEAEERRGRARVNKRGCPAHRPGRIAQILVADAQPVEYGTVLMLIE